METRGSQQGQLDDQQDKKEAIVLNDAVIELATKVKCTLKTHGYISEYRVIVLPDEIFGKVMCSSII